MWTALGLKSGVSWEIDDDAIGGDTTWVEAKTEDDEVDDEVDTEAGVEAKIEDDKADSEDPREYTISGWRSTFNSHWASPMISSGNAGVREVNW